jgi:hypothetical protein
MSVMIAFLFGVGFGIFMGLETKIRLAGPPGGALQAEVDFFVERFRELLRARDFEAEAARRMITELIEAAGRNRRHGVTTLRVVDSPEVASSSRIVPR